MVRFFTKKQWDPKFQVSALYSYMFPPATTDDGNLILDFWMENSTISVPVQNRLQLLHFQSLLQFFWCCSCPSFHHFPSIFTIFVVVVTKKPMPQDSHFHIHGDARCLENLLALNGDLTGTSFLSHLWDDKAFRNREFLKRQTFILGYLFGYVGFWWILVHRFMWRFLVSLHRCWRSCLTFDCSMRAILPVSDSHQTCQERSDFKQFVSTESFPRWMVSIGFTVYRSFWGFPHAIGGLDSGQIVNC